VHYVHGPVGAIEPLGIFPPPQPATRPAPRNLSPRPDCSPIGNETKGLLIGEGADPDTVKALRQTAESDPNVEKVNRILTMYFGPNTILLAMDLRFRQDLFCRGSGSYRQKAGSTDPQE
jgi:hypothetical protein